MHITAMNVPGTNETYWAEQAKIIGGSEHGQDMYDLVMSNAVAQRSDVLLLLSTFIKYRHIEFDKNTWFADIAYNVGCEVDCGLGQMFYEKIQGAPLENRAATFIELANTVDDNKKPFLTMVCEDIIRDTPSETWVDENGDYYNPYYESGSGIFSFIGKQFAKVNWDAVIVWFIIAWAYLALTAVGPFAFPVMLLCLFISDGNLDTCSLGIWGNGYTERTFDSDIEKQEDYDPADLDKAYNIETYEVATEA